MLNKTEHFFEAAHLLGELSPEYIHHLLLFSAWKTLNQSISSAETNNDNNDTPNQTNLEAGENACGVDAFADLPLDSDVKRILDVGGGKFDVCKKFMEQKNYHLMVWDPYNRRKIHNDGIEEAVKRKKVDAATSMAVLNVIPECDVRLAHISTLKDALAVDGKAYFKVWAGEGSLKNSCVPTINSYGYPGHQANAPIVRFLREIQVVFGLTHVTVDEHIPNLIVAVKTSDALNSIEEIMAIQEFSKKDSWLVNRPSRQSLSLNTTGKMVYLREAVNGFFSNPILLLINEYDDNDNPIQPVTGQSHLVFEP